MEHHGRKDLKGMRFGKLVVHFKVPEKSSGGGARWLCRCDCGITKSYDIAQVIFGNTRSCGCSREEHRDLSIQGDPRWHMPEFQIWYNMKQLCYNESSKYYHRFGAKGIHMSKEWADTFETFFMDMGPRPSSKHGLERLNKNGPFSRENCRWMTGEEKVQTSKKVYTWKGRTQTVEAWAAQYNLSVSTLSQRLNKGWSMDRALLTRVPVKTRGK